MCSFWPFFDQYFESKATLRYVELSYDQEKTQFYSLNVRDQNETSLNCVG